MYRIFLMSAFALFCARVVAHDLFAEATYLGNEGVLVTRGDTKVLFDAFFTNSYGQYTLVPDELAAAMLAGESPFDGVDAVFVSHVHGDHFSAEPAITYLRNHPQVQIYGTEQIREAMTATGLNADDPLFDQVHTFSMSPDDEPIELSLDGLQIEAAAIPHSGGATMADISNFAWRVTLDSMTTVIHLGDAGPVRSDFERQRPFFEKKKHHAAFVPYWLFLNEEGTSIIETYIRADQNIGVHVPSSTIGKGEETRDQLGADVFTDPGETRRIDQND